MREVELVYEEALNNKPLLGKYRTATAFSGSRATFKIEGVTMNGRQFVNDMERPDEPEGVGKIGYVSLCCPLLIGPYGFSSLAMAADKARLNRTTRVQVFSISAFSPGITVVRATLNHSEKDLARIMA